VKIFFWLRSFIASLAFIFLTLLCSVGTILEAVTFNRRKVLDLIASAWGLGSCWLFGVHLIVEGKENIPTEGCLFLFNHTSFFDIFSVQGVVPHLRFGAKIELFQIPIFGAAMRASGALPIAREKRQEVFKVYEEAKKRFELGDQFALAPEGTRNTEEKLRPFKSGPFVFAINGQVPVVPVVIKGAYAILPKGGILPNTDQWRREVRVRFLAPVSTKGLSIEDKVGLQQKVYQMMNPFFV
jgi:1-acyl-sn-glycerol-3-phosphate acyltransferase